MKALYIVLCIIAGSVILFFVFNHIYRYRTIDKGIEKRIANGAIILDVRTEREFKKGHIAGALNISLGTIKERYVELDPSDTYITYCSHGIRNMEVKAILEEKGFGKVYNGGAMSNLEDIIEKAQKHKWF